MRFVVIMDPPSTVAPAGDTTFALMEEAQKRGHRIDHCLNTDLELDRGRLSARVAQSRWVRDPQAPIELAAPESVDLHEVDAVFVRTDPPFDNNYLWTTHLLDTIKRDTLVVNDPHGLRQANEKIYACYFPELMPRTIISSHKQRLQAFVKEVGGAAVIKPLDGRGGEGVMVMRDGDPNINAIIELTTANGRRAAMAQVYMPEVKVGDKRILLLDGEPLGAILRVPASDEVRSNLRVGGRAEKSVLDAADRKIVEALGPRLRQDGLHFVGIDVIGGKLTEVNVTSPTGIQELGRFTGTDPSDKVIAWVEAAVRARAPR